MAKKLLENGFHVICKKPLTTTLEEAKEHKFQKKHHYFAVPIPTGYPMVREMKDMIANERQDIHKVDLQYYQDGSTR